ncbi:CPn0927/CPn0928 family alpha/beta hydrolase fold protein [Candidatus Chlamydia corallus]|uniref:CPn0927/CPn0928 family alpha/beta hydrolase fold protein n=1 Tax=Candidatus Chlamydia corallus TaxID=2038470 RepID=UPI000C2FA56D|nr:CPn0927/CPn0928 family alpha/beta hydrolase fold protein [Candidatus Chlamydia corallus]
MIQRPTLTNFYEDLLLLTDPQPSLIMFSSKKAQASWERRRAHPTLFKILEVIWNIVKFIIAVILFLPVGLFWVLQKLCQFLIHPAPFISQHMPEKAVKDTRAVYVSKLKDLLSLNEISAVQRVVMQYDELLIDSVAIKLPNAFPKRWILFSQGNLGSIENQFNQEKCSIHELAKATHSNILMFNYPGVMSSQGSVTRENLIKSYQACVRYLRDENTGPKATQIIAFGYSLGTSVQAAALDREITDGSDKISWIAIKDRGPRSLADIANQFCKPLGSAIVKLVGWNINSVEASERLPCPEIFIYNSDKDGKPVGDHLFEKENCVATPFLDPDRENTVGTKLALTTTGLLHAAPLPRSIIKRLAKTISDYLNAKKNKSEKID